MYSTSTIPCEIFRDRLEIRSALTGSVDSQDTVSKCSPTSALELGRDPFLVRSNDWSSLTALEYGMR